MTPRPAVFDDYSWLYDHGYMPDGLQCARDIMVDIVDRCPARFFDYGAGRGHLADWINRKTKGDCVAYDPVWDKRQPDLWPRDCDWVISCDVLEHLPEDRLSLVFSDWGHLARRGLLLTIANMSDVHAVAGEEVELHLIQKPVGWWIDRMSVAWPAARFTHREINRHRFVLIVEF